MVAQFALSIVADCRRGPLPRTLVNLSRSTPVSTAACPRRPVDPQGTNYEHERLRAFNVTCSRHWEAAGRPRVVLATSTPFNGNIDGKRLTVPGVAPRDADDGVIQVNLVGPATSTRSRCRSCEAAD